MRKKLLNSETYPISRLINTFKNQIITIRLAILCSIINKILDLAPPVLIGISIDIVSRGSNSWISQFGILKVTNQLLFLAIISCLIWTAESFSEYLYGYLWRNLAQISQHNLRIKAYEHLQKLELSFFENDNSGRLLSVINDDINQLERFLDHGANQLIQLFTTVILVGTSMAILAPNISFLAFIPIPIVIWGSLKFQSSLTPRYKNVREKAGKLSSRLSNSINGIATIKSFATEDLELENLKIDSNIYQKSNIEAIKYSAAFIPLIRFAILFAFISILIFGGLQAWEGNLSIGTYSFLVFITQRLLWPLTTLGHILDDFQRSMASTNRVLDLIDTPIIVNDGRNKISPDTNNGEIIFENVYFKYYKSIPLIENLNLCIKSKSTIGIVGSTGSGKSTLIKLILRFYPLTAGKILLNKMPIESYLLSDLRKYISLVSQEIYLFQGSIMDNISYGSNIKDLKKIIEAAKLAEADEFINLLPDKYKTLVGERGQKLSGGQKQKIAIARAILKNSPILILDEATASVDNETEVSIKRSISKIAKGKTTIIIAHRLSTVRDADEIIVLNNGRIIEKGNHKQLLNNKKYYYQQWLIQSGLLI